MKRGIIVLLSLAILVLCSCGSKKEAVVLDFSNDAYGQVDTGDLKLAHGDLLSVMQNERNVVVKAKIKSNMTNQMTIDQNYYSVTDLIKNHGFNTCDELQYWAVADMTSGDESKVISFTVDKDTIDKVYSGNILDNKLGEYVSDLWILPSLLQ